MSEARWTDGPVRITIPDPQRKTRLAAGQIAIEALREAGIDPSKPAAQRNVMLQQMLGTWGRGEWSRADFIRAAKNLLILNPGLGLKPAGR